MLTWQLVYVFVLLLSITPLVKTLNSDTKLRGERRASDLFAVKIMSGQGGDDPGIWDEIGCTPCSNSVTAGRTLVHRRMLGSHYRKMWSLSSNTRTTFEASESAIFFNLKLWGFEYGS